MMLTAESVGQEIQKLPKRYQQEIFDFVEFLLYKNRDKASGSEDREWNDLSLSCAMRGMEDEEFPEYTNEDFTEKWQ
ncbi:MAG: DUF2281 domain-containing protein [bacterium]|nr:DUF2281 domain-containing protein [bacterium]